MCCSSGLVVLCCVPLCLISADIMRITPMTPHPSLLRRSDDSRGHIQGLARTTARVLRQLPGHVPAACATHFMKRCRKWLMSLDTETSKVVIYQMHCTSAGLSWFPLAVWAEAKANKLLLMVLLSHKVCTMYYHPSCGKA